VSVLISSTDKNFLVPVGGSIVYCPEKKGIVDSINSMYPGRASGGPVIDLFLTLVEMGSKTLKTLLKERQENFKLLKIALTELLPKFGERVLETKNN
jgi:O-phospho-L-seryl-tRNASec:L-selenocysteinyl-tRNA synthase